MDRSRRWLQEAPTSSCVQTSNGLVCHQSLYTLALILSGVALTVLVVCCAILLLIKMFRANANPVSGLEQSREDDLTGGGRPSKEAAAGHRFDGARLVLFPGEQEPRILALPLRIQSGE